MNYVSGTVLKDLGKVPCIYFGDRTQEKPENKMFSGFYLLLHYSIVMC